MRRIVGYVRSIVFGPETPQELHLQFFRDIGIQTSDQSYFFQGTVVSKADEEAYHEVRPYPFDDEKPGIQFDEVTFGKRDYEFVLVKLDGYQVILYYG